MENDYGVASWNGIRDVQEADEGQTNETRGAPAYTFSFPRTRERNGFYVGAPSLRQFGAHTKRWPPVIQKFAGYGGTFTNDEGDFIPSVYLTHAIQFANAYFAYVRFMRQFAPIDP